VLADEPAIALLDAAALMDAARRAAGLTPVPVAPPAAAAPDEAPELNATARALLREVLASTDRELLADLLGATARAGARLAAPDQPAVLAVAVSHRALREPVAAVLGARGRWLAEQHPEWRRVIDAGAPPTSLGAWETGRLAERVAWLSEQRDLDPAGGREVLAAGWSRETGDDRVALLGALATGLSGADEPFLEMALDDRKAEVREQAQRLLARLPDSAFVARAGKRARRVLRRERGRLVVTLPGPPDAAARRDGLTAQPPRPPVGEAAWQLFQVVARAPLSLWVDQLRGRPAELVALEVAGEFGDEVRAGWRAAAVRAGDAQWAAALLTRPVDVPLAVPDAQLAALLPPAIRVARAIGVLTGEQRGTIADVAACPGPWPAGLTDAALGYFGAQARSAVPAAPGDLPRLLARRVDLDDRRDIPGWLRELAGRFRARTAAVPPAGRWPTPLERAADLLDLRRLFARELP
jgi:hypothetical protein